MKRFIFLAVLIIVTNLCADLENLIPSSRLPNQEASTINPNDTVYPWANSGCLSDIENNDGIIFNTFVDVSEEFSNSLDLASSIEDFIGNDGCNILFYFPAGTYELSTSIDLHSKKQHNFQR